MTTRPEDFLTEDLAAYLARGRRRSARLAAWRARMLAMAPLGFVFRVGPVAGDGPRVTIGTGRPIVLGGS